MKKTASVGRRFAVGLVALSLIVVSAEIGAKVILVWVIGLRHENYASYYESNKDLELLTWSFKYSPHPYFGYESDAIRNFERERAQRSKQDYVVAILGGSVAEMFAIYAQAHLELLEPLRAAFPELTGKRIILVNLAIGAGHQPQQYFIASFFLEDVDLFINIDGFNDAAIVSSMPMYPLEHPTILRSSYERTSNGRVYRWAASGLTGAYQALNWLPRQYPILAHSSAYFSVWRIGGRAIFKAVTGLQQRYFTAQLAQGSPAEKQLSVDELLERKVRMWRRYATLQSRMIGGIAGKRSFLFLQPNQYIAGSKELSEREKKTAWDPDKSVRLGIGMRRFKAELPELRKAGAKVYDLTEIFQHTKDTVYIDTCCHLNDRGNEIMAKAIVSMIVNER